MVLGAKFKRHYHGCFGYCHCLELTCCDSLSSSLFKQIDEELLRLYSLYYLHEKSLKKYRELLDLVIDLKEVFVSAEGV